MKIKTYRLTYNSLDMIFIGHFESIERVYIKKIIKFFPSHSNWNCLKVYENFLGVYSGKYGLGAVDLKVGINKPKIITGKLIQYLYV